MKSVLVITLLTVLTAACVRVPDPNESTDKILKQIEEDNKKIEKDAKERSERIAALFPGGQPGKITVEGVLVKSAKEPVELDPRIKVSQQSGKSKTGTPAPISNSNLAQFKEGPLPEDSKIVASDRYYNLGCTLSEEDTQGLKPTFPEYADEQIAAVSAKKIFICGSKNIDLFFMSFKADELVLKDVQVFQRSSRGGAMFFVANKLSLVGTNQIRSNGGSGFSTVPPTLEFKVATTITGEGTLSLESQGADVPTDK